MKNQKKTNEEFLESDFKQYKKQKRRKMPRNKKTPVRTSKSLAPKTMRLSVHSQKIGENRSKIKDLIQELDVLRNDVDLMSKIITRASILISYLDFKNKKLRKKLKRK